MSAPSVAPAVTDGQLVPDNVIPHGQLPPLRYRDLPPPLPLGRMIGPSLILAGLALGSGEFVLWPYITYKSQFTFFWAAIVGLGTQYFINMEIARWTLATGESAITGFIRLDRRWAWAFLLLNVVPWIIPAWATGAAQLVAWLVHEPTLALDPASNLYVISGEQYVVPVAIGSLVASGAVLTAGPVVYNTVEKLQMALVAAIMALVVIIAARVLSADAVLAQLRALVTLGAPDFLPRGDHPAGGFALAEDLDSVLLLGALAFAGAGGTLNLGQSNYVKDKGYGMGKYAGRITSPLTGKEEPVVEIGYHFPPTEANLARWRRWWRAASLEHFLSFFCTCATCLALLTLIAYSLFYDSQGRMGDGLDRFGKDMNFVLAEAHEISARIGPAFQTLFLLMGVAILVTTEIGVLDAASRISTDLVKVTWLRENRRFSESRLYFLFLWGTIAAGIGLLLVKGSNVSALALFRLTAAMNGGVMFLYSGLLLYLNRRALPPAVRMGVGRGILLAWAVLFFGVFAVWAAWGVLGGLVGA